MVPFYLLNCNVVVSLCSLFCNFVAFFCLISYRLAAYSWNLVFRVKVVNGFGIVKKKCLNLLEHVGFLANVQHYLEV